MASIMNRKNIFKSFKFNLYIGVGKSLFLWFLGISLIPLGTVSYLYYINAYSGMTKILEKSLVSTSSLRVENVNAYFDALAESLNTESADIDNVDAFNKLNSNNSLSKDESRKLQVNFERVMHVHNLENVYLINPEGDVVYRVRDDNLLTNNIYSGLIAETKLAKAVKDSWESGRSVFSDLEWFEQKGDSVVLGFFCKSLWDAGKPIGTIVYNTTNRRLNQVLMEDIGMGESGVAYIVGLDLRLRSASRFVKADQLLNRVLEHKKVLEWANTYEYKHIHLREGIDNAPMEIISIYQGLRGEWVYGTIRDVKALRQFGVNWGLIEELGHEEVFEYPRTLSSVAKWVFILTVIVVLIVSLLVTSRFVAPIKMLSAWAKEVAQGKLVSRHIRAPKDEVGEMRDTFNNLVNYIKSVSEIAQLIAKGDYSQTVKVRSSDDVLAQSINQMIKSFRSVVNQANTIANGDYTTNISPRSEKDTLGVALHNMTTTLRKSTQELSDQDWLKSGLGILNKNISGKTDIRELSEQVVKTLVEYMEGQIGLIYIADDENMLNLSADYALFERRELYERIPVGSGIIGEVAKNGELKQIKRDLHQMPLINDGISSESPAHVIVAPFHYKQKLVGVIVIGTKNHFKALHIDLFKLTLEPIAVATNAAQASTRLKELFIETQQQKERLQVQQEELRQTNEELEEQTKALKQSEEKLQSQKEELSVINEELEERSTAIEHERDKLNIANEQLRTARIELEEKAADLEKVSLYKSEFLANMSHELRTPLNSILVLSHLLSGNNKGNLDGKQVQYADTIHSSGLDLLNLINDILDLSKVESGKMELHFEKTVIGDLMTQSVTMFKPLTDKKGLFFATKIEDDMPQMFDTDPQRVFQIIKNLMSNAIKFTETGEITIRAHRPEASTTFSNLSLPKDKIIGISVSDTGIGIPKAKLDLIFEAFQQADGTTSRKYGGTGLGLSITRTFSELLGGEVHVKSAENQGTTFTLYLPEEFTSDTKESGGTAVNPKTNGVENKVQTSESERLIPEVPQREEIVLNDDRDKIHKGDKFVLIIEDDKNFSKVLYDLASEHGFKCMIAASGETGLHFTDKFSPSAIILDIGLPGIDGWEVMERLKSNPKTRDIPVYFISAMDKNLEAMKMGAVGFITKPADVEKLNSVFAKLNDLTSHETKHVLVLDDQYIVRKNVVNLLGREGVEVQEVSRGIDALDMMKKQHFDCVILELLLADISGFDILRKIREEESLKDIPVIIYTSQELTHEQELSLSKMADSIILKGERSPERLLAETTLYMNSQRSLELKKSQQELYENVKDKEAVYRGKDILLVDDDMRNVFALSSILEGKQMNVIVARNGREAIEKLNSSDHVDLVLMDIMMPEMDGYEAMRRIRKDERFTKLPIIALTAKAMKDDRDKCLAAGANEYLSKPVETEKLLSMLRVWLYN